MGLLGEELVLDHERKRLNKAGVLKNSADVRHVAKDEGDGAGYDIASLREDGSELFIEVKTTRGTGTEPFFLTRRELAFAHLHQDQYAIYRVFDVTPPRKAGRFFVLEGDPEAHVQLDPTEFRARLRGSG
ncbi:DUF3883 domain-containing protein [Gemmatimonadota bacterium]